MSRKYRPYDVNQDFVFPPSIRDWLPQGHLAHFVSDMVDALDLSAILAPYEKGDGRGAPPYHPVMMIKLIVFGYCTGTYSSRRIEQATHDTIAFRFLSCEQHPDHDSIAEFRRRHLRVLAGMFEQILQLCREMGLVGLGHVSIDGSKFKANASKHKAMSYGRMCEAEKKLEAETLELKERARRLLDEAERVDAEEDKQYGKGKRGDEIPAELERRESRLKKIREAMDILRARAKENAEKQAEEARANLDARRVYEEQTGKKPAGRDPKVPDPEAVEPNSKAQSNFTDPESRIMVDGASKAFVQAYNGQIAVDCDNQIIVAAEVTQEANDVNQLLPIIEQIRANVGEFPARVSADAGYFSETNLSNQGVSSIDLYVPGNRQKHGSITETPGAANSISSGSVPPATATAPHVATDCPANLVPEPGQPSGAAPNNSPSVREQMLQKLLTSEGKAVYARRKAIVEPVYSHIKEARGFRRFSFRGVAKVAQEFKFVCAIHNLLKLFKAKCAPTLGEPATSWLVPGNAMDRTLRTVA